MKAQPRTFSHNGHYQLGATGGTVSVRSTTIYSPHAIGIGTLPSEGYKAAVSVGSSVILGSYSQDCTGSGRIRDAGYNSSGAPHNPCRFSARKHDLVHTSPKLAGLAGNGGPTQTFLPKSDSPLLNRIHVATLDCAKGGTDQRGAQRPQGVRCDIGSVEGTRPTA